eukprot:250376_1
MMQWFLSYICLSVAISDVININNNGPIEYCNTNPLRWNFNALTPYDLKRIKKLKQVHILARHGTRILPDAITTIFPNSTQEFECHWKTVNTRYYKDLADWMSFKMHFVDNEQIVEGSCAVSSSLQQVIPQHRTNAEMAKAFYIGEEPYQLMTQSQLNDIAGQLTYYNQLSKNLDIPEIKIISANYERTITSATVFMSEFLNINTPHVAMELYTHDYQSDPYTSNKDKNCPLIGKYINDMGMNSTDYKTVMKSDLMNKTQVAWYKATGLNYSYNNGEGAVLMYCGGLDVPLKYNDFLNVLNMSYAIREALLANNETSTTACKLVASPMAWLFNTLIKNHILYLRQVETLKTQGENFEQIKGNFEGVQSTETDEYYLYAEKAKLIYHSVHDTSILYMLQALGISNGREPMFAEMLTLEIYERSVSDPWYNKDIQQTTNELYANYLFRWTRKGKPLAPFPGCEQEFKYTNSNLCSLSVLMDAIEYGENIKTWEKTCQNVTEKYFAKKKKKTKVKSGHKHDSNIHDDNAHDNIEQSATSGSVSFVSLLWTFLFGVSIGIAIMMFINKYNSWFKESKYESIL